MEESFAFARIIHEGFYCNRRSAALASEASFVNNAGWKVFNVQAQGGKVLAEERKYRGKVPLHNQYGPEAKYAVEAEALLDHEA